MVKGMERVHVCNHTPSPVGKDYCQRVSAVPARAGVCADCTCKWRKPGVVPADPEAGLPTTSKRFIKMGILAIPEGSLSRSHMGTGGGSQKLSGGSGR